MLQRCYAAALQPKKDGRAHHGAAIDDAGAQGSTRSESVRWVEGAAAPTLHAEAVRPARICLERHAWLPLVTAEPRMGALIVGPQIHEDNRNGFSDALRRTFATKSHTHGPNCGALLDRVVCFAICGGFVRQVARSLRAAVHGGTLACPHPRGAGQKCLLGRRFAHAS